MCFWWWWWSAVFRIAFIAKSPQRMPYHIAVGYIAAYTQYHTLGSNMDTFIHAFFSRDFFAQFFLLVQTSFFSMHPQRFNLYEMKVIQFLSQAFYCKLKMLRQFESTVSSLKHLAKRNLLCKIARKTSWIA